MVRSSDWLQSAVMPQLRHFLSGDAIKATARLLHLFAPPSWKCNCWELRRLRSWTRRRLGKSERCDQAAVARLFLWPAASCRENNFFTIKEKKKSSSPTLPALSSSQSSDLRGSPGWPLRRRGRASEPRAPRAAPARRPHASLLHSGRHHDRRDRRRRVLHLQVPPHQGAHERATATDLQPEPAGAAGR